MTAPTAPFPSAAGPDEAGAGDRDCAVDHPEVDPTRTRPVRTALVAIRLYQAARTGRTSPCRFTPTCSQYAAEALERHGLRRGLRLTIGRLGRCRPGGPFGSDPVPE